MATAGGSNRNRNMQAWNEAPQTVSVGQHRDQTAGIAAYNSDITSQATWKKACIISSLVAFVAIGACIALGVATYARRDDILPLHALQTCCAAANTTAGCKEAYYIATGAACQGLFDGPANKEPTQQHMSFSMRRAGTVQVALHCPIGFINCTAQLSLKAKSSSTNILSEYTLDPTAEEFQHRMSDASAFSMVGASADQCGVHPLMIESTYTSFRSAEIEATASLTELELDMTVHAGSFMDQDDAFRLSAHGRPVRTPMVSLVVTHNRALPLVGCIVSAIVAGAALIVLAVAIGQFPARIAQDV